MNFLKKRLNSIIAILSFSFMLAVFAPLEVYLSNKGYFFFPGTDMLGIIGICFCALVALSAIVLAVCSCISEKLFKVIYGMFIGGIAGLYIQGNWDMTDYGAWNGDDIVWQQFIRQGILFAVLWTVLFGVCVFFSVKKHDTFSKVSGYICCFLGMILLYTLVVLLVQNDGLKKQKEYIATTDNELQLSKDENMIVLVVDTYDGRAFDELINKKPQYAEDFDGFTFYRDTMGAYTSTDMSIPMIVTGVDYKNNILYGDYLNQAYKESALINWLSQNGWEKNVYTDMLVPQNNEELGIENLKELLRVSSDNRKLMTYMYDIVLFRYLPQPLKRYFTFYPDNLKSELCTFDSKDYIAYTENNLAFWDVLDDLTAEKTKKVFQLIHIDGSHPPFYYSGNLELMEEETSYEEECEGVMMLMGKFLAGLKEADIYDNTTIIIMGDHGYYNNRQNPLLLVKSVNMKGKMQISDKPISFYDLQDGYIKLLNKTATSENVFDDVAVNGRERAVRSVPWNTHLNHDTYGGLMKEYSTTGAAYDGDGLGYDGNEFAPVEEKGFR